MGFQFLCGSAELRVREREREFVCYFLTSISASIDDYEFIQWITEDGTRRMEFNLTEVLSSLDIAWLDPERQFG